jgi:hypothetical protein
VPADRLAAYLPILAVFDRDPNASTADLALATAASKRTIESRRAELIRLGALHRTPEGYRRNGVEFRKNGACSVPARTRTFATAALATKRTR